MSLKIVTVVGARPQFIKAAAVSRVLRRTCAEVLVHTGQHYDDNMSKVFFDELDMPPPDCHLGIGSGNHGAQTGAMLKYNIIQLNCISEKFSLRHFVITENQFA